MSSVGAYLRQLRETRGVSLEHIAGVTRVSSTYLRALEADDFSALPVPVFTRGFVRAYCQALGESPDQALALYDGHRDEAVPPVAAAPVVGPRRSAAAVARAPVDPITRNRGPVLVSFVLLVVLGVALFVVTLVLKAGRETPEDRRVTLTAPPTVAPARPPAAPAAGAPGLPPVEATATAAPKPAPAVGAAGTAAAPGPPRPSTNRLVARATEPTWIRVRTEDGQRTEETIPAGQSREWSSKGPFTLTVGNAGGVKLELNGRALPPLGPSGLVIPRLVLPTEAP